MAEGPTPFFVAACAVTTACALMFMEGAGEGTRVSFAFLRRRVERRGHFNFLDIATQNFN